MSSSPPAFIFFDEPVSDTQKSLHSMCTAVLRYTTKNIPVVFLCKAYHISHKAIISSAQHAKDGALNTSLHIVDDIYNAHISEIPHVQDATDTYTQEIYTAIQNVYNTMCLLLSGIHRLRELSDKVRASLLSLVSALSGYTITLYFKAHTQASVQVLDNIEALPMHYEKNCIYVLIPQFTEKKTVPVSFDTFVSTCAQKIGVHQLDIFTHSTCVMTANTAHVPHAHIVTELNYDMALEIAALGGKIFHPTALHMLIEKNITTSIYSIQSPDRGQTYISKTVTPSVVAKHPIVITNQNDITVCTVRSPDMFHRYGYLEKLFAICTRHAVSVETLTTSEISITMTFFTKHCSEDFLSDLRTVSNISYKHNYSLISVISHTPWNNPQNIASVLQCIHPSVSIETLSISSNMLSFSFAVAIDSVSSVMNSIHKTIYS